MKKLIAVTPRLLTEDGVEKEFVNRSYVKSLLKRDANIIMLTLNNPAIDEILDLCDGIIFQGGLDIYKFHYDILEYAINNNIPVLGICMGMQIMGLYANNQEEDDLVKIKNHYDKEHLINNKKNSILYKLFGDKLIVNSRHNYMLEYVNIKMYNYVNNKFIYKEKI